MRVRSGLCHRHEGARHLACAHPCNNCNLSFCGGATHIAEHIREKYTCESDAFLSLKQAEIEKEAARQAKKDQQARTRWSQKRVRKLQKAGYEQKVVKWDTDSDSDASEEEALNV